MQFWLWSQKPDSVSVHLTPLTFPDATQGQNEMARLSLLVHRGNTATVTQTYER